MSTDAFFHIGKTHVVCQDYGIASAFEEAEYAVVSDGCSSSPYTDCGARLIATIGHSILVVDVWDDTDAQYVAQASQDKARLVGWPPSCIDATFLGVRHRDARFSVVVVGDGLVYGRRRDGSCRVVDVEFPTGAPAYASYLCDDRRRAAYLAEGHGTRVVRVTDGGIVTEHSEHVRDAGWVLSLDFPADDFDLVAVVTDGIRSFRHRVGTTFEAVPVSEVLPHLTGFKTYAGSFVTRRLRRFLDKDCAELGWHHDDDVAVAAVYKGAP